jgi:hypothetical protein
MQRARAAGDWDILTQLNTMLQKPVIKWHGFALYIPGAECSRNMATHVSAYISATFPNTHPPS